MLGVRVVDLGSKVTFCTRVHFETRVTSKCDWIASQFLDLSCGYQRHS